MIKRNFKSSLRNYQALARNGKANVYGDPREIKTYSDYLRSGLWHLSKRKFFRKKKNKRECFICGGVTEVHLHHVNYKHLFKAGKGLMMALCRSCHWKIHGLPYRQRNTRNHFRKMRILFENRGSLDVNELKEKLHIH